jgi:multiple sugar transport system substrate-binding protein
MRKSLVAIVVTLLVLGIPTLGNAQVVLDYAVVGFENVLPFHAELIDAFNASQTAIHVNIRNYPGDSENVMLEKLAVELVTGSGPDILYFNDKALPAFAITGAFADITPYVNRDMKTEINDFFPTSVNAYRIGSELYGLPGVLHTLTVYYNQDLLDQAGLRYSPNWTLDDFSTIARRTTKINADGVYTQWGLNGFNWWPAFLPFLWMYEGDFFTPVQPERQTYVPRANTPQSVQAFSWLQMTVSEGLHGGNFSGGTAALRVSNSSEGGFAFGDNWDYGHLPLGPTGIRASRLSSTGWVMGQASEHKDEAWEVMRYLFRAENIYRFAELSKGLGSRRSVVAKMVTQSNLLTNQHKSTLLEILEYSLPHPSCAVSVTSIENAIRTWYSRLYSGQIDALTMGNSLQVDLQALIL